MLELKVLGASQATLGGVRLSLRPRRLALLAYLALEGTRQRSGLAALLFEELDPDAARSRLRMELHRMVHSALGAVLKLEGETVQLEVNCDAAQFEAGVRSGNWETAAALYRGPLLEGIDLSDTPELGRWLETTRSRLANRYATLLEERLADLDAHGDADGALEVARMLHQRQAFSEQYCDALVVRLLSLGRLGEARQVQMRFRADFLKELGVEPQLYRLPSNVPTTELPSVPMPAPAKVNPPGSSKNNLDLPPLVGRENLWSRLEVWATGATGTTATSAVAVLFGEAGVGKSRLALEWAESLGGNVVLLRSGESSQDIPYAPLEATLREGRSKWSGVHSRWATDLQQLLPELGHAASDSPSDLDSDPGADSTQPPQPLGAVRQIGVLAEGLYHLLGAGGILLLEDLHWCDAASLAVVRQVLHKHKSEGLRVLATARPGESRARTAVAAWLNDLEREGQLTVLDVTPLGELAVLKLLRQLSGYPLASPLARTLAQVSGGNAHALLSLLRGLFEEGHLQTDSAGLWVLQFPVDQLHSLLPEGAKVGLLRQLDRHPQPVRRWLEAAALQGTAFDFDAAWMGSGLDEDAALDALEHCLAHRQVWAQQTQQNQYRFAHDLLRQAISESVTPARGQRIHRRLAEHLERKGAPAATLGHHWQGAIEPANAYTWWRKAAEEAARLYAHREALAALNHALECNTQVLDRLEVFFQQAKHLKSLNDLQGWAEVLDTASHEWEQAPSRPLDATQEEGIVLQLALERTHWLWRSDRLEEALEYSAPFVGGEANPQRGYLLHDRGCILNLLERDEEACQELTRALSHVEPSNTGLIADLHNALAQNANNRNELETGVEHANKAIQLFTQIGILAGVASSWVTRSFLHFSQRDTPAAIAALQQAVLAAEAARHLSLNIRCLQLLCKALIDVQSWELGLQYATQGIELCESDSPQGSQAFEAWLEQFKAMRTKQIGVAPVAETVTQV